MALAQGDVARARSGYLATYAERNLLDLATAGEETRSLRFDGITGEVVGLGQNWFGLGVFCRSSHGLP